jgi:hypothetical protein
MKTEVMYLLNPSNCSILKHTVLLLYNENTFSHSLFMKISNILKFRFLYSSLEVQMLNVSHCCIMFVRLYCNWNVNKVFCHMEFKLLL